MDNHQEALHVLRPWMKNEVKDRELNPMLNFWSTAVSTPSHIVVRLTRAWTVDTKLQRPDDQEAERFHLGRTKICLIHPSSIECSQVKVHVYTRMSSADEQEICVDRMGARELRLLAVLAV